MHHSIINTHLSLSKFIYNHQNKSVIPNTQSWTTKQYTNQEKHIIISPKYRTGNKIIIRIKIKITTTTTIITIMIIIIKLNNKNKNKNNENNNKIK